MRFEYYSIFSRCEATDRRDATRETWQQWRPLFKLEGGWLAFVSPLTTVDQLRGAVMQKTCPTCPDIYNHRQSVHSNAP